MTDASGPGATAVPTQQTRISPAWIAAYAAAVAVFALCLFAGLDAHLLWGDEAETAVKASNVLRFGVPRVDDGSNSILVNSSDANAQRVWTWSPWLQEYVCAGSLALFGRTTTAARLPFALATFLAGLLLARFMFVEYGQHAVALLSLVLFTTSVPVLLHGRQSRYYALLMLSGVGLLAGYRRLLDGRWGSGAFLLGTMLAVQAYCNYLTVVVNSAALLGAGLFAALRFPKVTRTVAVAGTVAFVLVLPWLIYARPWTEQAGILSLQLWRPNFPDATKMLNEYLIPLPALAAGLLGLVLKPTTAARRDSAEDSSKEWHLRLFMVLALSTWWVVLPLSKFVYLRYASSAFPIAAAFSALTLVSVTRSTMLRIVLAAVLSLTNVIPFVGLEWMVSYPLRHLEWTFPSFARGFLSPYDERARHVVDFLAAHAEPGDIVAVPDPEFPLIFYNRNIRIFDTRLRDPSLIEGPPRWALPASATGVEPRAFVVPPACRDRYEVIALDVPDTPRLHALPDPDRHQYATAVAREQFVILRRKEP